MHLFFSTPVWIDQINNFETINNDYDYSMFIADTVMYDFGGYIADIESKIEAPLHPPLNPANEIAAAARNLMDW